MSDFEIKDLPERTQSFWKIAGSGAVRVGLSIGAISIIGLVILMIYFSGESSKQNTGDSRLFIDREKFGQTNECVSVDLFTLTNDNGLTVKITNYGGIVTSILVPDKMGKFEDIV